MPKIGFVPGETIVINANIQNDSSNTINKAHIKLMEYSRYVAYEHGNLIRQGVFIQACGSDNRELRRKLATGHQIKFETSGALNSDIEINYPVIVGTIPVRPQNPAPVIVVPSAPPIMEFPSSSTTSPTVPSAPPMESPPPYYGSSNAPAFPPAPPTYEESVQGVQATAIDAENIEIKFETSGALNSDIEINYPVIVGTIPVRPQNPAPAIAVPSAPPIMEFPSSSATSPTVPSAPPMESPPPYYGSSNAPAFPPAPPTYEESVQGVQATAIDAENIEPFAPRYPFYSSLTNNTTQKNGAL
ncbi:unnamed protein product [Strongylus vulgaris]|uniref:Arrestin C-terminal-like domain-containing protein n=1 Tax=Strongylus vulgaris TaxID=40348 RepID=A0A3P7J575_STRVU|nr:unnamed protein product [Strongylus vulgaris]